MDGRRRMNIDPPVPTMPGWGTSGFYTHQTGIACIKRKVPSEVFGY